MNIEKRTLLVNDIKRILSEARTQAYSAVNTAMVQAYWLIGKRIVEEEQRGEERAAYGKEIIKTLSKELTLEFGRGYSERSLREIRQFYNLFKDFFVIEDSKNTINAIQRTPFAESENRNWRTLFAKLQTLPPDRRGACSRN